MPQRPDQHILKNGMVILGEPIEEIESAAFRFMLPAGAARLPEGVCGAANVIIDWIFRGAGSLNSRQLGDALDGLGLHRAGAVGSGHISLGAALEAGKLTEALELYADVIRRPGLSGEQFEPARQLVVDDLRGLDDDPRRKVLLKLREEFYPQPLGRSTVGDIEQLNALTAEKTSGIVNDYFNLSETIFSVAGKYDFDALCSQMEKLFETGDGAESLPIGLEPAGGQPATHIEHGGAQVHIGLMTGTVKPADPQYYDARAAVAVLSGGMSARLFTEVREKRGLCYAVSASYHGLKDAAGIMCYAGTTPEKAEETLQVIAREFRRLAEGISQEEMHKARVGLKSSLILQSESAASRAAGIGSDYYIRGRVRSLDEIKSSIEKTSVESVLQFLRNHPFEDFTLVTIGPKQVTLQ